MPFRFGRRMILALALLLSALLPATGRATVTPEAKAVLDRFIEVTGGSAALAAEHTTHLRSSLSAFGFKGTVESWLVRPNRSASRTELGPLKLRTGDDGVKAWRTDPTTGRVIHLDGKDLEDSKRSTYLDADLWLAPEQGGGKVSLTGSEHDSTGTTWSVLMVQPPMGREFSAYFNTKTGLIDRLISKKDQQVIITDYSDYTRVAGRLRPGKTVTHVVGMEANQLTATLDSLSVNDPVDDALFRAPDVEGTGVSWLKTPGVAKLPFRYGERHVWLKASINGGPPEDFIFDTGASVTVIDKDFAEKYKLTTQGAMQAQGAGSTGGASFSSLDSLKVSAEDGDGVELKDVKVAVLAINQSLAPYFWRPCAGVLGFDFISRFVNEIDYDNQLLVIHDPRTFQYVGKGTEIPMGLAGTVPTVHMKLDGQYEGDFRVDVGSSSTVDLHTPFVKKNGLIEKAEKKVEVTGAGLGGSFSSYLTRMKKIQLGPYSWSDPIVTLSQITTGALSSEDYAGNLGNMILDRFKCTFDYEHHSLYLEPGKHYSERDRFSLAGVELGRYGDKVQAIQVLAGSAADSAGMKTGDEVTAIDGKPALGYQPDDLDRMFREGQPGQTHQFELLRDGKKSSIQMRLREII